MESVSNALQDMNLIPTTNVFPKIVSKWMILVNAKSASLVVIWIRTINVRNCPRIVNKQIRMENAQNARADTTSTQIIYVRSYPTNAWTQLMMENVWNAKKVMT